MRPYFRKLVANRRQGGLYYKRFQMGTVGVLSTRKVVEKLVVVSSLLLFGGSTSKDGAELADVQMSKVNTLLKLIAYQEQHSQASDEEIAEGIGISSRHVRRCKKEVNLLRHQLTKCSLQPGQIQFLLSLLNQRAPDQKEIAQHFQTQIGISYTGSIRFKHPDEYAPVGWLEIGELTDIEPGSLDNPDPMLFSWVQFLCNDPLLISYQNGEIEERLAVSCEAVKGHSEWQLALRKDLRWSDGKPITFEEIIKAFSASRIAPIITAIKPDGKTQLRIRLSQEEALFPFWLRYICPRPSHSTEPYRVTSGAYRLNRYRPDTMTLYFEHNPDYYRGEDTCIDWLTVKRFTRPANAVRAIEDGTIDLLYLYLHALQPLYQFPTTVPCQQWPFFQDNYYALLLNRDRGLFSDKRNYSLLKQSIDYRAINFYLRMGEVAEEAESVPPSQQLDIRVACSRVEDSGGETLHHLAHLIGRSAGSTVMNPTSVEGEMREEVDAFLTQLFLGLEYNRLSRFFHSDGIHNFFGYTNPQVDTLLSQLDQTTNMPARRRIGRRVLDLLQEDFAVILLAPCFEYTFSPLEIKFDDNLTSLLDLLQNMNQVIVERHQSS